MTKKIPGLLLDIIVILCAVTALWVKLYWLLGWLMIPYLAVLLIVFVSRKILPLHFHKVIRISIKTLLIILYSTICKLYVLDLYRVSGESMEGTLNKGDVLLINKLAYGPSETENWSNISWIKLFSNTSRSGKTDYCVPDTRKKGYAEVKRNDIVVYELFPGYFVVKRCIGLPGDILRLNNDSVYVNNYLSAFPRHSMSYYKAYFYRRESIRNFLNVMPQHTIIGMYPDSGYIVANLPFYEAKKLAVQPGVRIERLLNDQLEGKRPFFLPERWTINNMGPLTVPFRGYIPTPDTSEWTIYESTILHWECQRQPRGIYARHTVYSFQEDFYYMLGDNRQVSEDSRYLGFIPKKNIVGKAVLILYSQAEGRFNWKRLLKTVD